MAHYQTTDARHAWPSNPRNPAVTTFASIARDVLLSELQRRCSGPNSARRAFQLMAELRAIEVAR
jgi:hypothetical protein